MIDKKTIEVGNPDHYNNYLRILRINQSYVYQALERVSCFLKT